MMAVSLGTIVLYTLAVSALALSFGVFYPQFGTENAAQIPTSFGGVVYMMASLSLLAGDHHDRGGAGGGAAPGLADGARSSGSRRADHFGRARWS